MKQYDKLQKYKKLTRLLKKNSFLLSPFRGEEEEKIEMLKMFKYDRYQESVTAVNYTFCLPLLHKCLIDLQPH